MLHPAWWRLAAELPRQAPGPMSRKCSLPRGRYFGPFTDFKYDPYIAVVIVVSHA